MTGAKTGPTGGDEARLGATPVVDGTRFEVWAPGASTVEIVLDGGRTVALEPTLPGAELPGAGRPGRHRHGGDRTWVGVAGGVAHGDRYRVRLDGGEPLPDPASRHQPDGVHGPSAVVDPRRFLWTDDDWTGIALDDAILYELHVGTFTPEGTFDAAVGQLDRLAALGVTTIELMPLNAFPGRRNWGYDGVFVSAVQDSYGGPEGLAHFVGAAHARGLAVLVDVVYNHMGPEGNILARYGPYFTDTHITPWGPAMNVAEAGSDQVRRLFLESATGFVRDFHVDGVRVDAVHAIVDQTARPFLRELTDAVRSAGAAAGREVLVTMESSLNDPLVVLPSSRAGWGADAAWNDDVHHGLRVALTGEQQEYYGDYDGVADLADAFEHRWVFDGRWSAARGRRHGVPADELDHRQLIVFTQNHDHVGNTPRGERLLHDAGPADPRLRLAAAAVLLSPFTPMLFMGEEYGERAPFPFFVDHANEELLAAVREGRRQEFAGLDWGGDVADPGDEATFRSAVLDPTLAAVGPHAGLLEWYTELIRTRRATQVLTAPDAEQRVVRDDPDDPRSIAIERIAAGQRSTLVLHFGEEPGALAAMCGPLGRQLAAEALVLHSADPRWGSTTAPVADDQLTPWSARLYLERAEGL
jgi:maltooligosyltrehalose trehalohydrolase